MAWSFFMTIFVQFRYHTIRTLFNRKITFWLFSRLHFKHRRNIIRIRSANL